MAPKSILKKACGTEYIPSQKELEEVKLKWEQARNQMEASSQEAAELLGKVNAQKERAADQKQIEEQEKRLIDEEYELQEQMKSNKKKVERYQLLQNQIQKIQEQIATKREEREKISGQIAALKAEIFFSQIWKANSLKSNSRISGMKTGNRLK